MDKGENPGVAALANIVTNDNEHDESLPKLE